MDCRNVVTYKYTPQPQNKTNSCLLMKIMSTTIEVLRSLSFDNNGLVKPSCRTVALYGPFWVFLRYGRLSMNNLG